MHCAVPSTHLTCSVHFRLENGNINILSLLQPKQALPSVRLMLWGLLIYVSASEAPTTAKCWWDTDLLCLSYFAAKRSGNKLAWASSDLILHPYDIGFIFYMWPHKHISKYYKLLHPWLNVTKISQMSSLLLHSLGRLTQSHRGTVNASYTADAHRWGWCHECSLCCILSCFPPHTASQHPKNPDTQVWRGGCSHTHMCFHSPQL